jgi:hypothetical protein
MKTEPTIDKSNVTIISHILIRDPDSGEILVKQRDTATEKKVLNNERTD